MALWDVNTSQPVTEYEAHEKRIWSVDFCHTDPMLFLSGSDDGWVKVQPPSLSLSSCRNMVKEELSKVWYLSSEAQAEVDWAGTYPRCCLPPSSLCFALTKH